MVKHGLFGLSLVRAETGELYLEHENHGGDGIYAEVEPEDEYYLHLRSDAPEVVYVDLKVDGKLIQKGHKLRPGTTSKVGVIREVDSGELTSTEVALRFARARVHDNTRETAAAYWTGQVEATFYGNPTHRIPTGSQPEPYRSVQPNTINSDAPESVVVPIIAPNTTVVQPNNVAGSSVQPGNTAVPATVGRNDSVRDAPKVKYVARKNTYYVNRSLASSDVGFVPGKSAENQKKGVKSAEGTTALREHNLNWKKRPAKPKKPLKQKPEELSDEGEGDPVEKEPENLGSLTLRYCSAVGLIHAGVLARPPNWEWELARYKNPRDKREREEEWRALYEPKLRRIELMHERVNGRGEKMMVKREVDLFDLTEGN